MCPTRVAAEAEPDGDEFFITRTRAEEWARRAVRVGKLVKEPRDTLTAQRQREWDAKIGKKARQIVARVVLPGEWYLVRWGGTRKGSGTFYTRPGLAVPTVHRTLRPLAYTLQVGADGQPHFDAPASAWTPRTPEEILALKVCDPACGSGTFPVAALRFLTDALYASLHHHGRISEAGERAIVHLLDRRAAPEAGDLLGTEQLRCRPSDETFEPRLKAISAVTSSSAASTAWISTRSRWSCAGCRSGSRRWTATCRSRSSTTRSSAATAWWAPGSTRSSTTP